MTLIGMSEAARRVGVTRDGVRRALQKEGVQLVEITPRAFAVEEADLQAFLSKREGYSGIGRPRKQEVEPMAADISEGIEAIREG